MSGSERVPSRETGESYGNGTGLLDPRVMNEVFGSPPLAAPELPQDVYRPGTQTQPVGYEVPVTGTPVVERQGGTQGFDWRSHFPVQVVTQQYDPRYNTAPGNGEVYDQVAGTCGGNTRYQQAPRYDARYQNEVAWQSACNGGQRFNPQQQWQQQQRLQQQQWEQQQRYQQAQWQQQQWQQQHQQRHPDWQQQQWQQQQWEQQQRQQQQWQQQQWQQQQWQQQQQGYGQWNQQQQYWDQQQRYYDQQRYHDQVNYGQRYGNGGCNQGGFNGRQYYDNNVGRQLTNAGIQIGTNLLLNQINGGRGGCYGGGGYNGGFNGGWNQGYNQGGWNQGYNRGGFNQGYRGNQAAQIINTIQAFTGGGRGYRGGCR